MKSYKDLINECPELGDIIAELVGEVDFLNNLHTPAYSSYETPPHKEGVEKKKEYPEEPISLKEFNQLKAMTLWLRNRMNEHIDASKKASKAQEYEPF